MKSCDVDAADAAMEALWRRSRIGGGVRSVAARLRVAWLESWCRRALAAAGVRW